MKVIDKQLMFISSQERDSGSISDFQLSIPSHLLTCRPHQSMRVILHDLVLPYTFYNVQESNRHCQVVENGSDPFTVSLTSGSYHAIQLQAHLQEQLRVASLEHGEGYNYTVSFDEVAAKFKIQIPSPSGVNQLLFTSTDDSNTAAKLLGFAIDSVNTFANTTIDGQTVANLSSTGTISMILTDALLFHCDLLNTNVDKGAGSKVSFHVSDVFAKLPIDTSPFNNLIFRNVTDDYMIMVPERRITQLGFRFTTMDHTPIELNDDFSFTLKIEVLEDDEKTMVSQNTGIAEILRLLFLQQHNMVKQQHPTVKKSS